jgi:hypothetical protein
MKFEFSEAMVVIIGKYLCKGPFEEVALVVSEFQRQIDAQRDQQPQPSVSANGKETRTS